MNLYVETYVQLLTMLALLKFQEEEQEKEAEGDVGSSRLLSAQHPVGDRWQNTRRGLAACTSRKRCASGLDPHRIEGCPFLGLGGATPQKVLPAAVAAAASAGTMQVWGSSEAACAAAGEPAGETCWVNSRTLGESALELKHRWPGGGDMLLLPVAALLLDWGGARGVSPASSESMASSESGLNLGVAGGVSPMGAMATTGASSASAGSLEVGLEGT